MAEALHIPLKFPFKTAAGQALTRLPINRVKRKDITVAQASFGKDEVGVENYLTARMVGLTVEDLEELDIADSSTVTLVFQEVARGGDGSEVLGRGAVDGAAPAAERDSKSGNE